MISAPALDKPSHAAVRLLALGLVASLAGCASVQETPPLTAAEGRAIVARALPESLKDRSGWATDIYAAFAALEIAPTPENVCSAVAVTAQESGFQVDPAVPGLPDISRKEIDRRRQSAGIPAFALEAALALPSTNGRSYSERLQAVKTEKQLSEIYEDFIGRVPFGKSLLADRNPVRTGGPMQVGITFAEGFAAARPYPYPVADSIRHEVFTRRGGMYFGIAHLLAYPAPYPQPIYRFADFNAGRYASRNAAFQAAVTRLSGIPLELDGDLLRYERGEPAEQPGSTELAVRVLAQRLDLGERAIRRDLEREKTHEFDRTRLYERVFALADRQSAQPAARAVLPKIPLRSPKITRNLTSEWFATRVDTRYRSCLQRLGA